MEEEGEECEQGSGPRLRTHDSCECWLLCVEKLTAGRLSDAHRTRLDRSSFHRARAFTPD